jgi:putative tryptophan/tyrosine transport system substrate-binding protein
MRRREFVAGTAATAAMGFAQPIWAETNARSTGAKRLAIFHPVRPPEQLTLNGGYLLYKVYFEELNRLGYIEGQNLIVERYSALGQPDRIGDLMRQIVASRPDVILPISGVFIKEIMAVTTSIPMVAPTSDPVSSGFSSSLARPDRNFTGVVVDSGLEIWAKRVQLLLEAARKVIKVGYLVANPTNVTPNPRSHSAYMRTAAERGGIAVAVVVVAGKIDRAAYERTFATVIVGGEKVDRTAYEKTFDAMEKEGVDGLIVGEEAEHLAYRQLIADLAARFRIPAIYPYREFVEVGGLMAYGVDTADMMRRVANMTGQVLGGAKPSDIPFYQQTKYELVLNEKAARSLGLEFPATLLTAADAVVD